MKLAQIIGAMRSSAPVSSKTLGLHLPPGYHLLRDGQNLILCHGEVEVKKYLPGSNPKEIEDDAAEHLAGQETPLVKDTLTGLLWSSNVRNEVAALAAAHEVHAIGIRLGRLDTLMEFFGHRAPHLVIRKIAKRLMRILDDRDLLVRHAGDMLLIFTTRSAEETGTLVDSVRREASTVAVESHGEPLPKIQIGVAHTDRVEDLSEVDAVIDALIISAESAVPPDLTGMPNAPATSPIRDPEQSSTGPGEEIAIEQPARPTEPSKRIVLKRVSFTFTGHTVTGTVGLEYGDRKVSAKNVSRVTTERHPFLIADATARGITQLLPSGHGISVQSVQFDESADTKILWVAVSLLTPTEEKPLLGISPVSDTFYEAAAKAVLNAVNRRVGLVLSGG